MEKAGTVAKRGGVDIAIAGLPFHAGLRHSEAAALRWGDVADAPRTPGAPLVTVRASKTSQDGRRADVRMVKGGFAAEIRNLRPAGAGDGDPVLGGLSAAAVARRLQVAANAANVPGRITGHIGRVGLASELVARGASTADLEFAKMDRDDRGGAPECIGLLVVRALNYL